MKLTEVQDAAFQNIEYDSLSHKKKHMVDRINSLNKELQQTKFKRNDIQSIYYEQYKLTHPNSSVADFVLSNSLEYKLYKTKTTNVTTKIDRLNNKIGLLKSQLQSFV